MTTTQLLPPLSHYPHPCEEALLLPPLRYVRCKRYTVWILSRLTTTRQYPHQPFPFPTSEVLREGKCSYKGTWTSTVCTELFLGSALHLRILGTICLPQCSQRTFLASKKISQKNISTIFPFFAPLSQWLLQIEAHVPISSHKVLVFSFCTPRYTLLPVFCHQQTTIETNRSSTHLSGM